MQVTLPAKYYLAHARELFGFVQDECSHLLEPAHSEYLETFNTISEDAQCLLVRCLARKPRFIKIVSLAYPEITNIAGAIKELESQAYVSHVKHHHWQEFIPLLTKPQLTTLLRSAQCSVSAPFQS